mmetsp:Transcript_21018/g.56416  ORF Transcript_21018/g.56416 Transcript_21018/m.56416 type:complete len:223 (-) Transcript_21018:138-806(-)
MVTCGRPPVKLATSPGCRSASFAARSSVCLCASVIGFLKSSPLHCSSAEAASSGPQSATSLYPRKFLPTLLHHAWSTCMQLPTPSAPMKQWPRSHIGNTPSTQSFTSLRVSGLQRSPVSSCGALISLLNSAMYGAAPCLIWSRHLCNRLVKLPFLTSWRRLEPAAQKKTSPSRPSPAPPASSPTASRAASTAQRRLRHASSSAPGALSASPSARTPPRSTHI